jgi:hypothetical protein
VIVSKNARYNRLVHPRTRELLTYLDDQRAALRSAFDAVPPDARERCPADGGWSPAGVVEHLAIVEMRIADRLSALLATSRDQLGPESDASPILPTLDLTPVTDRSRRIVAANPVHPTGLPADAAWRALDDAGQRLRTVVASCDGLAIGGLTMPHPVFGPASLHFWFAFVGAHEARHAAQIRNVAAPAT